MSFLNRKAVSRAGGPQYDYHTQKPTTGVGKRSWYRPGEDGHYRPLHWREVLSCVICMITKISNTKGGPAYTHYPDSRIWHTNLIYHVYLYLSIL